jgi:SAM-dependent methyltransferase
METLSSCPVCDSQTYRPFLACVDHTVSRGTFRIVECLDCGFRYTNPRPEERDLGSYYESEDYISHSNTSKGLINKAYQFVRNITLKRKLKLIDKYGAGMQKKVLDIGCGTGEFLSVCKQAGWECLGVEPSAKARQYAIKSYGLNVMDEPDLLNAKDANIITMWHVLEHVPRLNQRMQELHQLLTSSGTLFIAVPNCGSFDAELYGEHWAAYDVPRHLYHFRSMDISRLAGKHGFRVAETLPMKFDSFYVSMLSEKYKTGSTNMIRSTWNGLVSNLKAGEKSRGYSSQIYVLKKA